MRSVGEFRPATADLELLTLNGRRLNLATRLIRIATRKSQLALWQAEFVAEQLRRLDPDIRVELVGMVTLGDKILDAPLAKVGGKGLFVKELEQGILRGDADIAVHSMKDVPSELPAGLGIGAILEREDPRDALVSGKFSSCSEIPPGSVVGTSSLRRQMQFKAVHPDCQLKSLRGNVNTRLDKLDAGEFDAILLASAGLKRLGFEKRIREAVSVIDMLPAIGQGAIGIESRNDDVGIRDLLAGLHHGDTDLCIGAERAMNARLNGGCQVPIAGHAQLHGDRIWLRGLVGEPDGSRIVRFDAHGSRSAPEELGLQVAEELLSRGADRILEKFLS